MIWDGLQLPIEENRSKRSLNENMKNTEVRSTSPSRMAPAPVYRHVAPAPLGMATPQAVPSPLQVVRVPMAARIESFNYFLFAVDLFGFSSVMHEEISQ